MKLYNYWRSSSSWRVRIALAIKNVDYEYEPVHLVRSGGEQHSKTFRDVNPVGHVPVLEWIEGGVVRRLHQSMAILEYLEDRYPQPSLWPHDPFQRAQARSFAETINASVQPLQNLSVMQRLQQEHGVDSKAWSRWWIHQGLRSLESMAVKTAGMFSVGDTVSAADMLLIPQLYNARRFDTSIEVFPTLIRIEERCEPLEAFKAARPELQPDAIQENG